MLIKTKRPDIWEETPLHKYIIHDFNEEIKGFNVKKSNGSLIFDDIFVNISHTSHITKT